MAVKRRNKSVYISVYSYIIPTFWLKNPMFPGVFVSILFTEWENSTGGIRENSKKYNLFLNFGHK